MNEETCANNVDNDLLNYMIMKNYKTLIDKIKVNILDSLIKMLEEDDRDVLLLEEIKIIREGVEEARNKEKEEDLNNIGEVINNLIGRFSKQTSHNKDCETKRRHEE